ncbi:MAG: nuclear transport factor 2 family protein [Acidobacteriota bacterium]
MLHNSRALGMVVLLLVVAMALWCGCGVDELDEADSNAAAIDRLALEVERAEAVRAVKTLQRSYAQYVQFGLWNEMASLFAEDASFTSRVVNLQGREAIGEYFLTEWGNGKQGLAEGELRTQLVFRPLVNLSVDGRSAKGRWWEFSMLGRTGVEAGWAGGIYENEYSKEEGVWKISRMQYHPMFSGPYETGWRNVDEDQKVVPYHFTADEAGIPVPEIPAETVIPNSGESPEEHLVALERRIASMNEEDRVRNLQNAYGYYVDRKMWDDVTDLFAEDGVLEIGNIGIYEGEKGIRRALERSGPAGLKHGQLHDHLQLDTTISVDPGGREAHARGLEFAMLGEADRNEAFMALSVFVNRYIKENGVWKIREMRLFPVRKTD